MRQYRCPLLTIVVFSVLLNLQEGYGQSLPGQRRITCQKENIRVADFFNMVWYQAQMQAFYNDEQLSSDERITVNFKNEPLDNVLAVLLRKRGLTWYYREETFVVLPRKPGDPAKGLLPEEEEVSINGLVTDGQGRPLHRATVLVTGGTKGASTDKDGRFRLFGIRKSPAPRLAVRCVGYLPRQIGVTNTDHPVSIQLTEQVTGLDEVMVIAYGTTSRRQLTGSVSRVSALDIASQPVADPLLALQGRVPGLSITQRSGLPGGEVKVELRGRNSIAAGNDPLYIVDGIPFPGTSLSFNTLQNANSISPLGASNPLNMISVADIESIEVLKDADATAIYGSRGANGIILISTKKPKIGKMKLDATFYTGIGRMAHGVAYMDSKQYLAMRREAFANDHVDPHTSDYDIVDWDTTRHTDWQKLMLGATAHISDGQLAIGAGSETVQLRISGGYRRESTIYPGSFAYQKASGRVSFIVYSPDQRTRLGFSTSYVADQNHLPSVDLALYAPTSPNTPELYESDGTLNWEGGNFENPMSATKRFYKGNTNNLMSNLVISQDLWKGLQLKASVGFNKMDMEEKQPNSFRDLNPGFGYGSTAGGYTYFADGSMTSWIAEPQLQYERKSDKFAVNILLGATFQEDTRQQQGYLGTGFNSDAEAQLENMAAATSLNQQGNFYYKYRYNALFGRLNINWQEKYLLNLTGRRDGSSRFGPGNQLANFGAVGAAWIFSKEPFMQDFLPVLSFGKLRASYGSTGNDQIRDYGYFSTYTPSLLYGDQRGQWPTRLFNPNYGWELNRKSELGLELGFTGDRIIVRTDFYSNIASNQLINYSLSSVTGFPSILDNLPAKVRNYGWELDISARLLKTMDFSWSTGLNFSLPKNELLAFPGLANSAYNEFYTVGQPLNIKKGLEYTGVDPINGMYRFTDYNKDEKLNSADYISHKRVGVLAFGGWQNNLRYKGWSLDLMLQFVRQNSYNYLLADVPPGYAFVNQPREVLQRWQKPGDQSPVQLFTQGLGAVHDAYFNAQHSDLAIADASYLRLKNLHISYRLPAHILQRWKLQEARIFMQGQNLFTVTSYKGRDPEVATDYDVYPPLRICTLGLQFIL